MIKVVEWAMQFGDRAGSLIVTAFGIGLCAVIYFLAGLWPHDTVGNS